MKRTVRQFNVDEVSGLTYILLFHINNSHYLEIGKLGWHYFHSGYYIYIGSAKKFIKRRLTRHLSRQKNQFWHIDYLLSNPVSSEIINIWTSHFACECTISQELYQNKICTLVKKGFGSSDCHCIAHFFRINKDDLDILNQILNNRYFYSLANKH